MSQVIWREGGLRAQEEVARGSRPLPGSAWGRRGRCWQRRGSPWRRRSLSEAWFSPAILRLTSRWQECFGKLREREPDQGRSGLCGRLGTSNNRRLSLTVLRARSPRPRCQQVGFILRSLLLDYRGPRCHCVLAHVCRGREGVRQRAPLHTRPTAYPIRAPPLRPHVALTTS